MNLTAIAALIIDVFMEQMLNQRNINKLYTRWLYACRLSVKLYAPVAEITFALHLEHCQINISSQTFESITPNLGQRHFMHKGMWIFI